MRNLFLFFARFSSFFVFLLLEVICLILIVRSHSYHKASFINSTNFVTGNIYQKYSALNSYLLLQEINSSLAIENARLRTTQQTSFTYPDIMSDSCGERPPYNYIASKVINNTTHRANNYLTLNKGSLDGINPEMGIIGQQGIVGIVTSVSDHFSSVMSVLHKNSRISVKLKKQNYPANLIWNGGNPTIANLTGIPQHIHIDKGDSVVTSGFSSIFPEHIMVGVVSKSHLNSGSNFFDVQVKLSTNFATMRYVYAINHALKEEQKELEANNE